MSDTKKPKDPKDNTKAEVVDPQLKAILEQVPEDMKAIAAEYPDFAEIIAGANYDSPEPDVENPDPGMKYYLAAPDERYPHHPANVSNCQHRFMYRVSKKKVINPVDDCVLMEQPLALYNKRKAAEQLSFQREMNAVRRHVAEGDRKKGLEVLDRRGVDNLPPGVRRMSGEE